MAGFLCHYLQHRQIPYELICVSPEGCLACDLDAASGLIFLGAPQSVNGPDHWISDEISIIRRAAAVEIPVMGVCFGGQLITRALGGQVHESEHMQVGWHCVHTTEQGRAILAATGLPASFHVFEWHAESFSLPAGASPLFYDINNNYQGFLHGKCLAMQFHLEMTEELILASLKYFADCLPPTSAGVQSREQILLDSPRYLTDMHQVAENIYGWWLGEFVVLC